MSTTHELHAQEMKRMIYQVNKRMYRLEKSGANNMNSVYENALTIIRRGENKSNKMRLSIPKDENKLKEQYIKALEITGSGNYEELTTSHIKAEIKRQKIEDKKRQLREMEERGEIPTSEKNRKSTFSESYNIDDVDYATYNLLKTKDFKNLAQALGSDVALQTIAPAINTGLGTSQLKTMIRDFMKTSGDGYYQNKLADIVDTYVERYS